MSARSHTIVWSIILSAATGGALWLAWPAASDASVSTAGEAPTSAPVEAAERAQPAAAASPASRSAPVAEAEEPDWSGLTGVVVRTDGTPIPGAEVALREAGVALGTTTANGRGRFRFADAATGHTYFARAQAPGYLPAETPLVLAAPVRLVLELAAALRGRVEDPDHQPIADAHVLLQVDEWFPEWGRTTTDARGVFALAPIPLSRPRTLWVLVPGYAPETRALVVKEPGEAWLDITLTARVPITGEVRDLLTNTPIAGATVRGDAPVPLAETGADGRFTLRATAGRPLSLQIGKEGHVWIDFTTVVAAEDATRMFAIRLPRGVDLTGVVRDTGGRPLAGARITVAPVDLGGPWSGPVAPAPALPPFTSLPGMPRFRTATSAADGTFRLSGLLINGRPRLHAALPGYCPTLSEPLALDPTRPVEPIVFTLQRSATVHGRVTLDGQPVGADVVVMTGSDWAGHGQLSTGPDGRFVLTDRPPGAATVVARAAGKPMLQERVAVQLAEGQVAAVELHIQDRVGFVSGRVLDRSGRVVAGARVYLGVRTVEFNGALSSRGSPLSAADGTWRLELPWNPDELVDVTCMHAGANQTLKGIRQGTTTADFVMPVEGTLRLDVRDALDPAPVEFCVVEWRDPATGATGHCSQGTKQLTPGGLVRDPFHAPVGVLDLVVSRGNGQTMAVRVRGVTVGAEPDPVPVPVVFNGPTAVVVTCPDDPTSLRRAGLALEPTEPDAPRWRHGVLRADGERMLLRGVPPGRYRVVGRGPFVVECAPFEVAGEAELTVPIVLRRKP